MDKPKYITAREASVLRFLEQAPATTPRALIQSLKNETFALGSHALANQDITAEKRVRKVYGAVARKKESSRTKRRKSARSKNRLFAKRLSR